MALSQQVTCVISSDNNKLYESLMKELKYFGIKKTKILEEFIIFLKETNGKDDFIEFIKTERGGEAHAKEFEEEMKRLKAKHGLD